MLRDCKIRNVTKIYIRFHIGQQRYILFDNWQVWEIDSLISMSRYKEGLEVYRNTEKRLMDELGIAPSPQLVERFRFMGERASQAAGAIEDIKYRLMEKENVAGAYYCSYPSFVDVYMYSAEW